MNFTESAKQYLGSDFEKYRQTLNIAVHSEEPFVRVVNQYVLGNRGKEIRPVLSLLAGKACGATTPQNYYVAAATEMLHTATLMHDDVADVAKMRRGALSVSSKYSPAVAVLSGDFWLARSLYILNSHCSTAINIYFAEAIRKMSEGELLQLDKAFKLDTTEDDYYRIIYGKTAALFSASLRSAAEAADIESCGPQAGREKVEAITKYADNIGMAFQIRDDILDYSPASVTGKLPGADLKERKITLPLIGALKNAPHRASQVLSELGKIEPAIAEIADFVLNNGGLEYSRHKLSERLTAAVDSISCLAESPAKQMLGDFAEYMNRV